MIARVYIAASAATMAHSSGSSAGTVSSTCVSSMSPRIIARHRRAPATESSLVRSRMAPTSCAVSCGHCCGQSHVAMVAMAMPHAVRILASGSASPFGRSSRMAAFSSSPVCGGKNLPSPSCQCSLTYFLSTTAASCLVPGGTCRFSAQRTSARPKPGIVPPCVRCCSAFTRVASSGLMLASRTRAISSSILRRWGLKHATSRYGYDVPGWDAPLSLPAVRSRQCFKNPRQPV